MKSPVRLLAVDIDGTLLDAQFQISDANLSALRRVHSAGIEVVLVTGRRHRFAVPVAEKLGFDLWLISSNGAITRSLQGESFHCDFLPARTAGRLLAHMQRFRSSTVLTFDREDKGAVVLECADELNLSIRRWMDKNSAYIEFMIPLENALVTDPVQVMFCGTVARMREAQQLLAAAEMERDITVLKTEYEARDLTIIDVLNFGCSKGHALERWARHRDLARDEVMAIGDNYNDIEMLEFAGVPVIMANACAELRQNGWTVTRSNEQSGVAAAVEELLRV